ncbi:hypothetical protein ASG92_12890 [Arthrobacter sp. Soil736]|uniref:hypothetical protein n=1 Tax=Arthrobacter sp. Soil736 TaxID=1736395 RepID=UPI0006FBC496|nr:hypothetical protein [Arthrobacter sp. Soil736]KRE44558.1 hypothetical protein ASG92_12890 [Arthrobacter sp. Soil736]
MKRLYAVPLSLFLASGAAGCSTPEACPAIGWSNSATVVLEGRVDDVAKVQFCADGVCSVTPQPTTAPKSTITPSDGPIAGQAATAAPVTPGTPVRGKPYSPYFGKKVNDRTWQFSATMNAPKGATVRVLNAEGGVLAERDVELTWTRVGGSEQCGGPSKAGPIALSLP